MSGPRRPPDGEDEGMITKAMVEAGYAKEVIRLRDCPEGDEVVCQIGEYWFYSARYNSAAASAAAFSFGKT